MRTEATPASNTPVLESVKLQATGRDDMSDPEELQALAAWKVHTLTGGRKGTWSLSVTRNRRAKSAT